MRKQIVFRLDAGHQPGMGHLIRMKILANVFEANGADCIFVIRSNQIAESILKESNLSYFHFLQQYSENKIATTYLSENNAPDLWIYDILDTDSKLITLIKSYNVPVVCFDDLKGGLFSADLVINGIAGCWGKNVNLPHVLQGPDYVIINPDIKKIKAKNGEHKDNNIRLGITLGGSDTYNVTAEVVKHLLSLRSIVQVTVFLGPHYVGDDQIKLMIPEYWTIKKNVMDIHLELAEMDAVICGGGVTLFEMCAMGKLILAIANEIHEEKTIGFVAANNACADMGSIHKEIFWDKLSDFIGNYEKHTKTITQMKLNAQTLVDGQGVFRCHEACCNLMNN